MTIGESDSTHYIDVLSIAIFFRGKRGKNHSLTATMSINPVALVMH